VLVSRSSASEKIAVFIIRSKVRNTINVLGFDTESRLRLRYHHMVAVCITPFRNDKSTF
jgi:hypothetical protein